MKKIGPKFWVLTLAALLISQVLLFSQTQEGLEEGVLDLRSYDFSANPVTNLDGFWRGRVHGQEEETVIVLPQELSNFQGTLDLEVTILLPPGGSKGLRDYAIKIPYFGSAYEVYINGEPRARTGSVDPFIPRYIPRELQVPAPGEKLHLKIVAANYHHRRMRLNRILFGTEEAIGHLTKTGIIKDSIIFGSLLLLALYHLLVFAAFRRDRSFLYFSLIAFITALRTGVVHERVLVRLFPDMAGELMMKLGYAPVFILLPLLILYFSEVTQRGTFHVLVKLSKMLILLSGALLLFFPLRIYDWLFQYAQGLYLFLALYCLYIIFGRGLFTHRIGKVLLLLGGTIILLAGINDYLREISVIDTPEMVSGGILLFLLIQAFFLAWKLDHYNSETVRLAQEVQGLNSELEKKIEVRTNELKEANLNLEKLSRIDGLTELPNRRYFEEAFDRAWRRSEREKIPLSLIMIDVDSFKDYNDNYGHPAGDSCLQRIAAALDSSLMRGEDFAARYGGEEFVVLLPGHHLEEGLQVAEKLREAVLDLAIEHSYSSANPRVSISLGVAEKTKGLSKEALLQHADQALYRAKHLGKNRVKPFSPDQELV